MAPSPAQFDPPSNLTKFAFFWVFTWNLPNFYWLSQKSLSDILQPEKPEREDENYAYDFDTSNPFDQHIIKHKKM